VEDKQIKRAILSVTDKTGLTEFARRLAEAGVELISTGGTARSLREAGLAVRDISDLTGIAEMLDGRVKTLHPKVHGGILYVRDDARHRAAVAEHGIEAIDMVVVNLYAFARHANRPGAPFGELIENIDIGGPALIRSAAKNFEDVAVVTSPDDYAALAGELEQRRGALSLETRWSLARKAFAMTAAYDSTIAATLRRLELAPPAEPAAPRAAAGSDDGFPGILHLSCAKAMDLRYGENPHQRAALYVDGSGLGVAGARQLQGKELSYNNLVDLDAAWDLAQEFGEPAVAIVKHTNPCGAAIGASLVEAYRKALATDPVSAYGGVVGVNRELDDATAEELAGLFVEAIAAPAYSRGARERLGQKKNLRLLEVKAVAATPGRPQPMVKQISGGILLQDKDEGQDLSPEGEAGLRVVSARPPSDSEMRELLFAWRVAKHVKSNAIVYTRDGQTLGVGAGQMSRVDAAKFGAAKSVLPLAGSVAASDAFFPFPDGVEAVAAAGATAVIQPGGSVRDDRVIEAADRLGLAMIFTGMRHFLH
jgi:phosphoribosylaminoimidazolecarboxamide formyltransferase/IMP cyclohydrolase